MVQVTSPVKLSKYSILPGFSLFGVNHTSLKLLADGINLLDVALNVFDSSGIQWMRTSNLFLSLSKIKKN